jgi:hypothetical protein
VAAVRGLAVIHKGEDWPDMVVLSSIQEGGN